MESLQIKAQEIMDALKETSVIDYAEANNMSALSTRLLSTLQTPYDLTKMAYVVYLSYLVDMFHTRFPIRKSAAMLSEEKDVPLVVMRHLLALYTDSTQNDKGHMTYLQAKAQKDKLILYMLVVALTINGFSLDLTEVSADLKKTPAAYVLLSLSMESRAPLTSAFSAGSVRLDSRPTAGNWAARSTRCAPTRPRSTARRRWPRSRLRAWCWHCRCSSRSPSALPALDAKWREEAT